MRTCVPLEDEEGGTILPFLPKTFKKIREGLDDGGVLIFCESGQASTALTAAFLMAEKVESCMSASKLAFSRRYANRSVKCSH
jgi:hypothetical protein